jgi:YD repeat-containing protein
MHRPFGAADPEIGADQRSSSMPPAGEEIADFRAPAGLRSWTGAGDGGREPTRRTHEEGIMRGGWMTIVLMGAALGLPGMAAGQGAGSNAPAATCLRAISPADSSQRASHMPPPNERMYDVVLDVPALCVNSLQLGVRNLNAHLALSAQISNLVEVTAGADARIARVKLGIYDVQAKALLLVDLDDVREVVDHTMTFIDNNPQIVSHLASTVENTVGTVGQVANTALQPGGVVSQTVGTVGQTLNNLTQPGGVLTQTVNTLGQTVQTTLDTAGNLVSHTLDSTGRVLNTQTIGALARLPVLQQTTNAAGQVVKQVRTSTGMIVEYTADRAGKVLGARIVQQATGGQ